MIGTLFHSIIYLPIYNALVFAVDIIPTHDIGIAVIFVTILVRIILWPLAQKAIAAQSGMKKIAPEVEALKKKHKGNPQEEGRALIALYKENNINPISSFLLLLVQLPILLGLYWVFARGGFPAVNADFLYSFVGVPESVNMHFLGLIPLDQRSIVLAILATIAQYLQIRIAMGPRTPAPKTNPEEKSFAQDMQRSIEVQTRYILPAVIGFVGVTLTAVVPLYMLTASVFTIGQEYANGKRF